MVCLICGGFTCNGNHFTTGTFYGIPIVLSNFLTKRVVLKINGDYYS